VGTPSLGSPTSGHFFWKESQESLVLETDEKSNHNIHDKGMKDVGFQICIDLLTNELAAGLLKKHPDEYLNRSSGLQIQLMIEAYESVQQHVRREIDAGHMTGKKLDQVKAVERTLDNWLEALHVLYEGTQPRKIRRSFWGEKRPAPISPTRPWKNPLRQRSVQSDLEEVYYDCETMT